MIRALSISFMLVVSGTLGAAEPASVKAKVEEPVLQELMGGCSLKCASVWTVEVQPGAGLKPFTIKTLNDEDAQTTWSAPAGQSGVGIKLKLNFPEALPGGNEEEFPLYGLDLVNGDCRSDARWKAQGRVKKVRLYYNGKPFLDAHFADSRRWQRLTFPDIFATPGDSVTMEILETYPGAKGSGVAITEIVLQGGH